MNGSSSRIRGQCIVSDETKGNIQVKMWMKIQRSYIRLSLVAKRNDKIFNVKSAYMLVEENQ